MDILPFELQSLICSFSSPEDLVVLFNALGYLQPVILGLWPSFGHLGLLVATKFDNVALAGASQPSYSRKALEIACKRLSRGFGRLIQRVQIIGTGVWLPPPRTTSCARWTSYSQGANIWKSGPLDCSSWRASRAFGPLHFQGSKLFGLGMGYESSRRAFGPCGNLYLKGSK